MTVPTDIAGLAFWFKADAIGGLADGDPVTTWPDSSGNARDATQASATLKPTWQTNEQNGLPIVRFDGSNDLMSTAAFSWPQTYTILAVAKTPAASVSTEGICNADPNANRMFQFRYETATSLAFIVFNTAPAAFTETEPCTAGTFQYLSAVRRATNAQVYVNGTSGGSTATTGTPQSASQALRIGAAFGTGTLGEIDLAELVVYDTALSDADRQSIEAYLNARWFGGGAVALTGTSAGTSSTTGAVALSVALGGTSAGASSTSGAVRVQWALTGVSSGTSTTTGSLEGTGPERWLPASEGRWQPSTETRWPLRPETRW